MQHDPAQGAVRPLTRRGADGEIYRRTSEVEGQITLALGLETPAVIARAEHNDPANPGYLREEAIIYLIRASHQDGDALAVNALFAVLLARCERLLRRRLGGLEVQTFEDAYGDCVTELATQVLDLTSDRGDFLQVRFWPALERMATTIFNRHMDRQRQTRASVPLPPEEVDEDDARGRPAGVAALQEERDISAAQRAEYREGLAAIPEPYRTAFVLRYYHGWPVEDRDPAVATISRYFKKTGRTIRNYLQQADAALAAWRGEER